MTRLGGRKDRQPDSHIQQAVELTLTRSTLLGGLVVGGETGTGVVERVDEEERSGTSGSTGGEVTSHPETVAVTLLVVREEGLVVILEGAVE